MAYRKWSVGQEVLATEFQQYLQDQAVNSFASAAARDSAIPVPVPGMTCFLVDVKGLTVYDGTGWKVVAPGLPASYSQSVIGNGGQNSSTTGVALPVNLVRTFTKQRADTWLRAQIGGHVGIDDAGSYCYVGISLDGAAFQDADATFGAGVHTINGFAGTGYGMTGSHTIQVQWRVSATSVVASMYGRWNLLITESY